MSLLADKEKEMNALKKAESHSLKEEESCRRKLEGEVIYFLLLAFLCDMEMESFSANLCFSFISFWNFLFHLPMQGNRCS